MVKIRLTLMGKHKNPYYRIVLVDSKRKRDGAYIELLGTFDPKKGDMVFNKEAVLKALKNGAQPTESILNSLKKQGIYKEYLNSKNSIKKNDKPKKEVKQVIKKNKK